MDELLDPGGLIFEIRGPPFVSGGCLHFSTNMVYGLQGIYGLTDATTKDVRAPFLLLTGYVCALGFFLGESLYFLPNLITGYTDV